MRLKAIIQWSLMTPATRDRLINETMNINIDEPTQNLNAAWKIIEIMQSSDLASAFLLRIEIAHLWAHRSEHAARHICEIALEVLGYEVI